MSMEYIIRWGNVTLPTYPRERLHLVTRMVGDVGEDTGYRSEVFADLGRVEGGRGQGVVKVIVAQRDE